MNEMLKKSYAEQFSGHKWEVEFECGSIHLRCLDPCETYDCTPACDRNKDPDVIFSYGLLERLQEESVLATGAGCQLLHLIPEAEGKICACMATAEEVDALSGSIPVRLEFVDDSTPSGPWGSAEYSHYIVVHQEGGA